MHTTTILSAACLVLLSHFTPAAAAPTGTCPPQQPPPAMPASSLPSPSTTLKYVAIGLGTQNYTCTSTSATPVAAGAIANLYDATYLMSVPGLIGQTAMAQGPCYADRSNSAFGLRQIGVHYFNGAGQPNFDLTMAGNGEYLQAKKMAAAAAPSNACSGRSGDAAVPWLYLAQDGSGVSAGIGAVYRVVTAGGNAASCSGATNGWVTRDYSAEYWFFE